MDKSVIDLIEMYRDNIYDKWKVEIEKKKSVFLNQTVSDDLFARTNDEFFELIYRHFVENHYQANDEMIQFAERLAKIGWRLSYLTQGLQIFRRVLLDILYENIREGEDAIQSYQQIDRWMDPLMNEVIELSASNWENKVSLQKVALQELSAPLIPVLDRISVMPLIGTIDTERAKLIMENLLQGVIRHRSEVVLIDITGVPVVDTMVAHHIIQAAEAVRLVGAMCILVGIRPEIAQTIVNLGIDLGQFPTKSTLFQGFQYALELTNRQIIDIT